MNYNYMKAIDFSILKLKEIKMKRERHLRQSLISAVLVLAMLFTSLVGTTFAWFTDQVSSAGNKIQAGNLQADLLHKTSDGQ